MGLRPGLTTGATSWPCVRDRVSEPIRARKSQAQVVSRCRIARASLPTKTGVVRAILTRTTGTYNRKAGVHSMSLPTARHLAWFGLAGYHGDVMKDRRGPPPHRIPALQPEGCPHGQVECIRR